MNDRKYIPLAEFASANTPQIARNCLAALVFARWSESRPAPEYYFSGPSETGQRLVRGRATTISEGNSMSTKAINRRLCAPLNEFELANIRKGCDPRDGVALYCAVTYVGAKVRHAHGA
jgi:hypothetical protein